MYKVPSVNAKSEQLPGEGPPVFVPLAGLGTTRCLFNALCPILLARGSVFHPPPLLGQTVSIQAEELLGVLPDSAILIAHSYGGYLAFEALRARPTSIKALVLINTSARAESAINRKFRVEQLRRASTEPFAAEAARRFETLVHHRRKADAGLRQSFVDMAVKQGIDAFVRQSRAAMTRD